jgi:hypothetical protein
MGRAVGPNDLARLASRRMVLGLVVVTSLTLAGCGGSGSHKSAAANRGGGASSGSSLTAFCKDNAKNPSLPDSPSAKQYSQAAAIVQRMIRELPSTAPASINSEMVEVQADLVSLSKGETPSDSQSAFATAAQDVYNWASANCGGASSGAGSTGAAPTTSPPTNATSPDTSGSSPGTDLTAFCGDLNSAVNTISQATDPLSGNAPPSKSALQQYETTVTNLINESSSSGISSAFGGDPAVMSPLTSGLNSLSQHLMSAINGGDLFTPGDNGKGVEAVTQANGDATLLQTWVSSNCGPNYSNGSGSNSGS